MKGAAQDEGSEGASAANRAGVRPTIYLFGAVWRSGVEHEGTLLSPWRLRKENCMGCRDSKQIRAKGDGQVPEGRVQCGTGRGRPWPAGPAEQPTSDSCLELTLVDGRRTRQPTDA